ncbi:hypothetical protein JCM10449v2_005808 [Rhodotorula kratochvilovae]
MAESDCSTSTGTPPSSPPAPSSSPSSTSNTQIASTGSDSSSDPPVGPWDHLPATKTLPLFSREMWLTLLDHLVGPPPTTTQGRSTRAEVVGPLVLINKTWAKEVLLRKTRSPLICVHPRLLRREPAYALNWTECSPWLADKYSSGVRSLVFLKADGLPLASFERVVRKFDQLYSLRIEGRRAINGVLTGSTTLRQLLLSNANEPNFSGSYPDLKHLVIVGAIGVTLAQTLTSTNFATLETLVLETRRQNRGAEILDYLATSGTAPPAVWNLSISSSVNYPYLASLVTSRNLENFHLCAPIKSLVSLLWSVERSLVQLTLTVDLGGADKDIHTCSEYAESVLEKALAAPCLKRLETLRIPRPSTTGGRWWLSLFGSKLQAQLKALGVVLEIVNPSGNVDPFTWRASAALPVLLPINPC